MEKCDYKNGMLPECAPLALAYTPMQQCSELMVLDFVVQELKLYLDTHADDCEAFKMLQECIRMSNEGRKRYAELYGPITIRDMENAATYDWIDAPWPWQHQSGKGD